MTLIGLLFNVGSLMLAIAAIAVLKYTGILDIILQGLDWMKYVISWLMENKIFATLFYFFLIVISSAVITFFLSLNYACDTNSHLREMKYGTLSGLAMTISGIAGGVNSSDSAKYNQLLNTYTVPTKMVASTTEKGLMSVNCIQGSPHLTIFGRIDFLNYRYWILICVMFLLVMIITNIKQWTR